MNLQHHADNSMEAMDIEYRWVTPGGYWVRVQDHEKALQVLQEADMLPSVVVEEVPV